jgi:lysozyme
MTQLDILTSGIIKQFESCRLTAYPDPGTGGRPWTIGWGTTGKFVHRGLACTQEQADKWLESDIVEFEKIVTDAITVDLNVNQLAALICFTYNAGPEKFLTSTLLKLVNQNQLSGASRQFPRWNRSGGKVLPGLVRRRAAEAALFNQSVSDSQS